MSKFSGQRVRDVRTAAGIPIERLALDIHRSVWTVADYERGRIAPPVSVVAAMADALGCSPGDLFADVA